MAAASKASDAVMAIAVRALFMGGSWVGIGDWVAGWDRRASDFRGADVKNPASFSTGGVRRVISGGVRGVVIGRSSQRETVVCPRKPLAYYARLHPDRDEAIAAAFASGGYTLAEIGDYFCLHYSRVSKIVRVRRQAPAEAKGKTPCVRARACEPFDGLPISKSYFLSLSR